MTKDEVISVKVGDSLFFTEDPPEPSPKPIDWKAFYLHVGQY